MIEKMIKKIVDKLPLQEDCSKSFKLDKKTVRGILRYIIRIAIYLGAIMGLKLIGGAELPTEVAFLLPEVEKRLKQVATDYSIDKE